MSDGKIRSIGHKISIKNEPPGKSADYKPSKDSIDQLTDNLTNLSIDPVDQLTDNLTKLAIKPKQLKNRRLCSCVINLSNFKKLQFIPFKENSQTFSSRDKKTVDSCSKWVNIKKTNADITSPVVCHQNGISIPLFPPFPRKLKDLYLPRHPNRSFLQHQKVLQQIFKEKLPDAYLLYWEMGSGKTIGILSALLLLDNIPPKITIVCSVSMIDYWVNNLMDFDTRDQTFDVEIMGYNFFENKFLEDLDDEPIKREMAKRIFIIDEAHHYRNITTNMERAINKYSFAKKLYLLTGTPLVNSADELKMWASFLKIETQPPSGNSVIQWCKSNLKGKVMYFNPVMNKSMKENESYPDVEQKTEQVPMTWMQTLMYFLSEGTAKFAGVHVISSKKNMGLSLHKQVANGFKDSSGKFISPKNNFLVKANQDNEKYPLPHVIFSGNLETGVEDIYEKLKKYDPTISIITGNTEADRRQEIVEEYNKGKINNLLLSRVGNEGINLLGTGTMFITTRHENEESANQTKARVVRYESHSNSELKKVKIIDLLSVFPTSDPSVEEKREMGRYMTQYLGTEISGDNVIQELKSKMKANNNITVEQHLNKLNKEKEATLQPVLDAIKEVGKQWWNKIYNIEKKEEEEKKWKKKEINTTTKKSDKTKPQIKSGIKKSRKNLNFISVK